LLISFSVARPQAVATGLPERAGLVHRAQRCELFHHVALGAEGRQRHAAADHLAHHRHVGLEAGDQLCVDALRTAEPDAEARHDFIERQQRAVLACTVRGSRFMKGT
jgi:hypothetical protein